MLIVTKYDDSGNDFIIFHDNQRREILATTLCNRHRGVGADGLVLYSQL